MRANDYLDWSEVSGIYLPQLSRADRYQAYQSLISESGWAVVVVAQFLNDNPEAIRPIKWRMDSVYEMGDAAKLRLQFTARALELIGAVKLAAIIASIQPLNMQIILEEIGPFSVANMEKASQLAEKRKLVTFPDCESRVEVESLLQNYMAAHQAELDDDIARYGDPRTKAGYTREKRMEELKELRRRLWLLENQTEQAAELAEITQKLDRQLAKAGDDSKALKRAGSNRSSFREALKNCLLIAEDDRNSKLVAALHKAKQLTSKYVEFFNPPVTDDEKLNARLEALGSYTSEIDDDPSELQWTTPQGYSGTWGNFTLLLSYPQGKKAVLAKLVTAAERLAPMLPELSQTWFRELIDNFRDVYADELDADALADFGVASADEITDDLIVQRAGTGQIQLNCEDGEYFAETSFPIPWDQEHGFPIEWDESLLKPLLSKPR